MSREIKFRSWDKELKQLIYDVQATYDGLEYSKVNKDIDVDVYDWMDCFESFFNDRRFDLMQYTGFKDKKGVYIYEGDALRDSESIVIVKFVDGEFSVDYRTMGGKWRNYGSLFDYLEDYECEVIGNIYENKNLLEDNS